MKETDLEQEGQDTSLNGASKTSNKDYFLNEQLEKTPFRIVGSDEKGYFLTLGNYRITDIKDTINAAVDQLFSNEWEVLVTIILALIHMEKTTPMQIIKP